MTFSDSPLEGSCLWDSSLYSETEYSTTTVAIIEPKELYILNMVQCICACLWVGVITPVCIFSTVCLLQCRSCCLTVFGGRRTRDFHRDLCVSSYWCVRNIIACFLHCYLQALFIDKWLQRGLNRSDSTETLICPHSLPLYLSLPVCHSLLFYLSHSMCHWLHSIYSLEQ